jgi:2-isopropylmalate synthase
MPKLTSLLPTLMHKKKIKCPGIDSTKSEKALAEFVAEKNNQALPHNQAYVGSWAFTHKAGSHQLGARIDPTLQEHINPNLVGAKRRLPISGEAGRNAVVAAVNELGVPVERNDPAVYKILAQIRNLDKQGFNLESAPSTFALIALRQLVNYQRPFEIKLIKSHSTLVWENGSPKKHRSEASIEIVFPDGSVVKPWERGNDGPVDAIKNALQPVLAQKYPILQDVKLIGFKVRIIKVNGKGTASNVRVSVTGKTPFGFEDTAAVSRNIIKASAMALMDLFEVTILKSLRQT